MNRWWFGFRCLACEMVFGLAIWICPEKYCPSYIETLIDAQKNLMEKGWIVSKPQEGNSI